MALLRISVFAVLAMAIMAPATAVDVDEQTRRCRIEKTSLTNPSGREGVECMKLRAMLGLPEPPVVNVYELRRRGGKAYYDSRTRREVREAEVYYAEGQRCEVRQGYAHCGDGGAPPAPSPGLPR